MFFAGYKKLDEIIKKEISFKDYMLFLVEINKIGDDFPEEDNFDIDEKDR